MRRKSLSTWIASTAATLGLVGAAVVSSAGTAAAASNGQQIRFYDSAHRVYAVYIRGQNQDGITVGHCFSTPVTDNYLPGWWWKGQVLIYTYESPSNTSCDGVADGLNSGSWVPKTQSGSDWYTIDDHYWWG